MQKHSLDKYVICFILSGALFSLALTFNFLCKGVDWVLGTGAATLPLFENILAAMTGMSASLWVVGVVLFLAGNLKKPRRG